MLAGLLDPSGGRARVAGCDLTQQSAEANPGKQQQLQRDADGEDEAEVEAAGGALSGLVLRVEGLRIRRTLWIARTRASFDNPAAEAFILPVGERLYQVQALTPIDELNEMFDATLSDEDYGTVGGLLLEKFGRVPEFGDTVTLAERFEFRVIKANNRRIITLEMNVLD